MEKFQVFYHPVFLQHKTPLHHPESAKRVQFVHDHLCARDMERFVSFRTPERIDLEIVRSVHSAEMLTLLRKTCKEGGGALDADTFVSRQSYEAALYAAGAVKDAVDLVFEHPSAAFCLVRPPGHHATEDQSMGFCLLNNVSIGAQYAIESGKAERVLILDFDAHHGNGTQDIFYDRSDVLYVSWHQYPLYPGTGNFDEVGNEEGTGYTINIPLEAKTGDVTLVKTLKDFIRPIVLSYRPDVILISAGYDGHVDDPLSTLAFTSEGYKQFFQAVKELAAITSRSRIVVVLEGGYNVGVLTRSLVHSLSAFCPVLCKHEDELAPETLTHTNKQQDILAAELLIDKIHNFQKHYWKV